MSRKGESAISNRLRLIKFSVLSAVLLVAPFFAGCQRKSGPISQEQTNLSWLGSMYGMYISENQGRPPNTVDDLRKFLEKSTGQDELARLKVASVNDLFVSPRDGKPFTMLSYTKLSPPAAGKPAPVVFYETEGQNGQHAIAFLGGGTQTVGESELQKLLPAPRKTGG